MGLLSKAAAGSSKQFEEPISQVYKANRGGLLNIVIQKNKAKTKKTSGEKVVSASALEKKVLEKLTSSFKKSESVQGLVIEALESPAGDFTGRLSSMVSGFGAVQGLAPGRSLVLFSPDQDGDLIGKHLAKTVPGNTIFSFHSDNPQDALSLLKPFL